MMASVWKNGLKFSKAWNADALSFPMLGKTGRVGFQSLDFGRAATPWPPRARGWVEWRRARWFDKLTTGVRALPDVVLPQIGSALRRWLQSEIINPKFLSSWRHSFAVEWELV
jgi:hypothetical protein